MQYLFLLIDVALGLWLVYNLHQSILAFRVWQSKASEENTFLSFLIERLGFFGKTFVSTIVYTAIATGITYLLYEIGAMIFA